MKQVYTTYSKAVHWCGNHYVLCNNIVDIDQSIRVVEDKLTYKDLTGYDR